MPDVLVIEAGQVSRRYWQDLWLYRELFGILAWRDFSIRYRQTLIGVVWAILRPLLVMIVFTTIFRRLANLPSDGTTPYSIMVFAGMLPWFLFSTILSEGSNSLVANANLIGKVYFPRLIIPLATIFVALIDFLISFVMLLLLMAYFNFWPDWKIFLAPFFLLVGVAGAVGPMLMFAAMNVKYRDFRYLIPFVVQLGLYVSPVGFSSSVVPDEWRLLYSLNPAVGLIDGFRWCLLGGQSQLYLPGFMLSLGVMSALLITGVWFFRRTERKFADVI